jgi:multidrug efflux pump subunit AcrA (membrane-fusion protein)
LNKRLKIALIWMVVLIVLGFTISALVRAAPSRKPAPPPRLAAAPARVYGRLEPAGGEVYVSAPLTRQVTGIQVREGDTVAAGAVLLRLESSVEQAELAAAQASIETFARTLALSEDALRRNRELYEKGGLTEAELTRSRLAAELDRARLAAAEKQAGLVSTRLAQLELRAPIPGRVYRLDARLGQTLAAGDDSRIILGRAEAQVRLYIEAYWSARVRLGDRFEVFDAETGERLGSGQVASRAPYLGRRNFRSDDPQERYDIEYQEVVLALSETNRDAPVGTRVMAELKE